MLPPDRPLTDAERHPAITPAGRDLLRWMREHPCAPRFNHDCGDRLSAASREVVDRFATAQREHPPAWKPGHPPAWVAEFAERCLRDVPFYRNRGVSGPFDSLPTCSRADLNREPWSFVPDGQDLEELIIYSTSGVTGHPLSVLSHPVVSSCYLPLLRDALAMQGVALEGGAGRVSIVLVCHQSATFTYASVSSYLDDAGFAKVNLHESEWRRPEDAAEYLDACCPEIYTGDPVSFLKLASLPLRHSPKALVSTAMTLLPGMREQLQQRFACPVVDAYSMNECRLVAAGEPGRHAIVPHDLYVETLDEQGEPAERGEVVVTCGRNPFLPLLRYRTGDRASLVFENGRPTLIGLEGRQPVLFRAPDGRLVNSIDVSVALRPLSLAQFQLRQRQDGSLLLRVRGMAESAAIQARIRDVFGPMQELEVAPLPESEASNGKVMQYASELG